MQNDPAYEEIRRMVEREFLAEKTRRARFLLWLNSAVTIGFLLYVWVRLFPIFEGFWEDPKASSLVVLSIAAVVSLIIHGVSYRLNTSKGERLLREQLLGRAMHDSIDFESGEKAKRHARLTDDGELLDMADDPDEREHVRKVK